MSYTIQKDLDNQVGIGDDLPGVWNILCTILFVPEKEVRCTTFNDPCYDGGRGSRLKCFLNDGAS